MRTFDVGEREIVWRKIRSTVTAIAEAAGAEAVVSTGTSVPVTGNDPMLLSTMMPTLQWAAGDGQVQEHPYITGAEDYSYYQKRIPGLFLMLGGRDPGVPLADSPSNHSPYFSPNEDALIVGVRALIGFAMDYGYRHQN